MRGRRFFRSVGTGMCRRTGSVPPFLLASAGLRLADVRAALPPPASGGAMTSGIRRRALRPSCNAPRYFCRGVPRQYHPYVSSSLPWGPGAPAAVRGAAPSSSFFYSPHWPLRKKSRLLVAITVASYSLGASLSTPTLSDIHSPNSSLEKPPHAHC